MTRTQRAILALGLTLPVSLCGPSYAAEGPPSGISMFCWYSMLIEFHEIAVRCKDALGEADEARYKQTIDSVRSYIVENTYRAKEERFRSPTFLPDYEAQSVAKYKNWNKQTCSTSMLPHVGAAVKGEIRSLLNPKSIVAILNDLKTPRDPFDGACM